jgi:hypothetical protein
LIDKDGVKYNEAITESIRTFDAIEKENDYIVLQFQIEWQFIDAEVRNYFSASLLAGHIKRMIGFNHYGIRNKSIN